MMQSALLVVAGVAIGFFLGLGAIQAYKRVKYWVRNRLRRYFNSTRTFVRDNRVVYMDNKEYILARYVPTSMFLFFTRFMPEVKRIQWEKRILWLRNYVFNGKPVDKTWKVYNKWVSTFDVGGTEVVGPACKTVTKSLTEARKTAAPFSLQGLLPEDRAYLEKADDWKDPLPNLTVKMMEELWRPPYDVSLIDSNWKVSKAQYMDIDWDKVLESKQVAPDMEPWWKGYTDHNPYENVGTESKSDQQEVVADHDTESPSGPDIWWKKAKAIEKAQLEETAEDPVYALMGPPEKVSPESLQRMIEETAKDPDYTEVGTPKESPEREVEPLSITLSDGLMADPERLQRFMVDLAEVAYGGLPVHILPRSKEDVKIPVQPSMSMDDALRKSEEVRYDRTPLDPPSFLRKDPEPTKVPKDLLQLMIEERAKKES